MKKECILENNMLYLNITNSSVERGFNYLKLLQSDNRRRMKCDNIFGYLALRINNDLFK